MQDISTKEDFARKLKEADIEVVYRINPEGRLYGITFIDHTNRTMFNGSRLGKAFSANVFNELFNNRMRTVKADTDQPEQDTPGRNGKRMRKNRKGRKNEQENRGTAGSRNRPKV